MSWPKRYAKKEPTERLYYHIVDMDFLEVKLDLIRRCLQSQLYTLASTGAEDPDMDLFIGKHMARVCSKLLSLRASYPLRHRKPKVSVFTVDVPDDVMVSIIKT